MSKEQPSLTEKCLHALECASNYMRAPPIVDKAIPFIEEALKYAKSIKQGGEH